MKPTWKKTYGKKAGKGHAFHISEKIKDPEVKLIGAGFGVLIRRETVRHDSSSEEAFSA